MAWETEFFVLSEGWYLGLSFGFKLLWLESDISKSEQAFELQVILLADVLLSLGQFSGYIYIFICVCVFVPKRYCRIFPLSQVESG